MNAAVIASRGLEFDPASHTYYFEGREVPSVTQVLDDNRLRDDFSKVPFADLEAARLRGQAVHLATHYYDEGTLNEATVDDTVRPYLEAWKQFKHERRVEIIELEKSSAHPDLFYAGTRDRVACIDLPYRRPRVVVDIKTGSTKGARYQLAAYAELYGREHNLSRLSVERWCVQLRPDSAVPYVVTPYRDLRDWRIFCSALDLTHTRAADGIHWRQAV